MLQLVLVGWMGAPRSNIAPDGPFGANGFHKKPCVVSRNELLPQTCPAEFIPFAWTTGVGPPPGSEPSAVNLNCACTLESVNTRIDPKRSAFFMGFLRKQ